MQTGKIGVSSENIFPVIKKFLYSEHEIFLRELISNAVDATQKLKVLASKGEYSGNTENAKITVTINKDEKTIVISDQGIGMTAEEVEKYINQIAISSAGDFLDKYKDDTAAIIGHFGLGFYSSFMVSKRVDILTKSYKDNAEAVKWSCDGSPEYSLETIKKDNIGSDIVLHIDDESIEFLEETRIEDMLKKYCRFLPVPISFGKEKEWKDGKWIETEKDKIINNTSPLWKKMPVDVKDKDYKGFYHELYPGSFEEPLFNIHLNVDYPFNLTGILYFPKIRDRFEVQKNKIQLYSNQVYVTDSVENIVPDYLMLLHGVLDSPDIPLNVSRSYLQGDPNIKKISSHITKKVADKLNDIFKNNREEFEQKWPDLKVFIQYGIMSDEKFEEKAKSFYLFTNTEGKNFTIEEYEKLVKENQTNKDKKVIYLYTSNKEEQYGFINSATEKGYDVLMMNGFLDSHFMNHFESKNSEIQFSRVDADIIDNIIKKEDKKEISLAENEREHIKIMFNEVLPKEKHFFINFEEMGEKSQPVTITVSEFTRRMKDMAALGGGNSFYKDLPDNYSFVVNTAHPLIKEINERKNTVLNEQISPIDSEYKDISDKLNNLIEEESKANDRKLPEEKESIKNELQERKNSLENQRTELLGEFSKDLKVLNQLTDLALLGHGMLKGDALNKFVNRSIELIDVESSVKKVTKKKAKS